MNPNNNNNNNLNDNDFNHLLNKQTLDLILAQNQSKKILEELQQQVNSWYIKLWKKSYKTPPNKDIFPQLVLFGSTRLFQKITFNNLLMSSLSDQEKKTSDTSIKKSTDFDIICISPPLTSYELWFKEFALILKENSKVSSFRSIPDARVPILTFFWEKIFSVDILFARIPFGICISDSIQDFDDKIFRAMDQKSIQSINGLRDVDFILNYVPNLNQFQYLLSVIKLWAKRRGIYSNKFGFLGGYSWSVCCAYICKKFPESQKTDLIRNFFETFNSWNFEKDPIYLGKSCSYEPKKKKDILMVLTSCFPIKNSTQNISNSTLEILKKEFQRGFEFFEKIKKEEEQKDENLDFLSEKNLFFKEFNNFIVVNVSSLKVEDFITLKAWYESIGIGLVYKLEKLEFFIHPFQTGIPLKESNFPFSENFFFGVKFLGIKDPSIVKAKQSNFITAISEFENLFYQWNGKNEFMDFSVKQKNVKQIENLVKDLNQE